MVSKIPFEPTTKLTREYMGSCFTFLKLELACQHLQESKPDKVREEKIWVLPNPGRNRELGDMWL